MLLILIFHTFVILIIKIMTIVQKQTHVRYKIAVKVEKDENREEN